MTQKFYLIFELQQKAPYDQKFLEVADRLAKKLGGFRVEPEPQERQSPSSHILRYAFSSFGRREKFSQLLTHATAPKPPPEPTAVAHLDEIMGDRGGERRKRGQNATYSGAHTMPSSAPQAYPRRHQCQRPRRPWQWLITKSTP